MMQLVISIDAGFELLPIAAGMDRIANVVIRKDRQGGDRITDEVVSLFEGFETDEIIRGAHQSLIVDGSPSHETSRQNVGIDRLSGIASQDMIESLYERAMLLDEMQYRADVALFEHVEKGRVDGLGMTRVFERPAAL